MSMWMFPDTWLEGDHEIAVGARTIDAVHTPGHTPGHYVFAEKAAGLLFAGDHVLPTITPSIGFTVPPTPDPLGDFMASLTKVRSLPDLQVLPAHGPVAPSSHAARRRAARLPRPAARPQPRRARRRPGDRLHGRPPARLDPPREGVRRARRVQPGHGRDGDQGAPRAARRPGPGDPRGHARTACASPQPRDSRPYRVRPIRPSGPR